MSDTTRMEHLDHPALLHFYNVISLDKFDIRQVQKTLSSIPKKIRSKLRDKARVIFDESLNNDQKKRAVIILAAFQVPDDLSIIEKILNENQDDPSLVLTAFEAISSYGKYATIIKVNRYIFHKNCDIRKEAIKYARKHPTPESIGASIDIFKTESNIDIRQQIMKLLSENPDRSHFNILFETLSDQDFISKLYAAIALIKIGELGVIDVIVDGISSKDIPISVKPKLVKILAQYGGERGQNYIEEILCRSPDKTTLTTALNLIQNPSQKSLPAIVKLAKNKDIDFISVAHAATSALVRSKYKFLEHILTGRDFDFRQLPPESVVYLFSKNKVELINNIENIFETSDADYRAIALRYVLRNEIDFIQVNLANLVPNILETTFELLTLLAAFTNDEIWFLLEYIPHLIEVDTLSFSDLSTLPKIAALFPDKIVHPIKIAVLVKKILSKKPPVALLDILLILGLSTLGKYPLLAEEVEQPHWIFHFDDYIEKNAYDYFCILNIHLPELIFLIFKTCTPYCRGNPGKPDIEILKSLCSKLHIDNSEAALEKILITNAELNFKNSYIKNTEKHFTIENEESFENLLSCIDKHWFSDKINVEDKPKAINLRPGQAAFKLEVIEKYGNSCAVCGLAIPELIEAAHLIPKKERGIDDPANGLPLCSLHHKAFDSGLFTFNPETFEVVVSSDGPTTSQLLISKTSLNHLPEKPARDVLLWRWIQWKQYQNNKHDRLLSLL